LRDVSKILLLGICGAGGAVVGVLCGLAVADSAARAFGDPVQFYHFAVVLAFIGAGIAIGTLTAHAVSVEHAIPTIGSILAAAAYGSASAVASCVIAQELLPHSHAADFAAVAWGAMGGFLGLTTGVLVDRYRPIRAGWSGVTAGAVVGWLLFDPAAQLRGVVMEAAALGFLIPAMIVLTDICCIKGSLPIGGRHSTRWSGA
jgi:hypothetical protein